MNDRSSCYRAFLLRLWCVTTTDGVVWRASLEDSRTNERKGFADLSTLAAFLEEQTNDADQPDADEKGGQL